MIFKKLILSFTSRQRRSMESSARFAKDLSPFSGGVLVKAWDSRRQRSARHVQSSRTIVRPACWILNMVSFSPLKVHSELFIRTFQQHLFVIASVGFGFVFIKFSLFERFWWKDGSYILPKSALIKEDLLYFKWWTT